MTNMESNQEPPLFQQDEEDQYCSISGMTNNNPILDRDSYLRPIYVQQDTNTDRSRNHERANMESAIIASGRNTYIESDGRRDSYIEPVNSRGSRNEPVGNIDSYIEPVGSRDSYVSFTNIQTEELNSNTQTNEHTDEHEYQLLRLCDLNGRTYNSLNYVVTHNAIPTGNPLQETDIPKNCQLSRKRTCIAFTFLISVVLATVLSAVITSFILKSDTHTPLSRPNDSSIITTNVSSKLLTSTTKDSSITKASVSSKLLTSTSKDTSITTAKVSSKLLTSTNKDSSITTAGVSSKLQTSTNKDSSISKESMSSKLQTFTNKGANITTASLYSILPTSKSKVKTLTNSKEESTSGIITTLGVERTVSNLENVKTLLQRKGHTGRVFWVAFPSIYDYHDNSTKTFRICIGLTKTTQLTIESASTMKTLIFQVTSSKRSIDFPMDFEQSYNVIEEKGILITANSSVSLFTLSANIIVHSDVSWIPPIDSLGLSYVALSHRTYWQDDYSYVSIVATTDNTSVTLNLPKSKIYDGQMEPGRNSTVLYLDKFQSYQFSSHHDVTGTLINSNYPILVQSGLTDLYFNYEGGCYTSESMYLPPTSSWGRIFVIPPIKDAKIFAIKIVSYQSNDTVTIVEKGTKGETTHHLISVLELQFPANSMIIVKCGQPCFVSQYPASEHNRSMTTFMVSVPSIKQFSKDYEIISPNSKWLRYERNFIAIMIKAEEANGLFLDNISISMLHVDIQTLNLTDTQWAVLTLQISASIHNITHNSSQCLYGVIVYGYGNCISYGFSAGFNL